MTPFHLASLSDVRAAEAEAAARAVADVEADIQTAAQAGPPEDAAAEPPPRGLTPRMEAFCQAYVARPAAAFAAVEAGYGERSARKIGSRLLRAPAVARRIGELRGAVAARCADGRAQLVAKLESVIAGAIEDHNWSAAARSIAMQARLAGLAPDEAGPAPARAPARDAEGAPVVDKSRQK